MTHTVPRPIQIQPVLNGFICQVGCQQVVFTSITGLIGELGDYYRDPGATEKRYIDNALNKVIPRAPRCLGTPPTPDQPYNPDIAGCEAQRGVEEPLRRTGPGEHIPTEPGR